MSRKNSLIVILGPTASGKSNLAIKLAKKFNGEIISADSRTIYKEMDIGTAKPIINKKLKIKNKKQKSKTQKPIMICGIPHYMIDIIKPNQQYSVAQFKNETIKIIKNIQKRKKIPFLVGGTGLYISSIVDNLKIPKVKADIKLRKKLERELRNKGINYLWKKLIKLDPAVENFIQKENSRRVIRALEICLKTKKQFSKLRKKGKPLFRVLEIGLKAPRRIIYERINRRVNKMVKNGLVEEVKSLIKKYGWNFPAINGIGYRQFIPYLKKEVNLEEAIEQLKKDTRHYAKRQITWFKKDKRIIWFDITKKNSQEKIEKLIEDFLKKTTKIR